MNETGSREKLVLTVPEMAKYLDIGKDQAYTLANRADFPAFKIGKQIRVSLDGLKAWIAAQTCGR
jgi:excisionase family DNA binding protein